MQNKTILAEQTKQTYFMLGKHNIPVTVEDTYNHPTKVIDSKLKRWVFLPIWQVTKIKKYFSLII